MAKLTRKFLARYGASGVVNDYGVFGSKAAGAPVNSLDVAAIQALTAWSTGLKDTLISGQRAPFLEDDNAWRLVHAYMACYLFQEGISEWDASTTYFIGGIVKNPGTSDLYASVVDNNVGNALPSQTDDSNWKYIGGAKAYRRPSLIWSSVTTVDIEAQLGVTNQTSIKFPDGGIRAVTEDLGVTQKYRRFDVTLTANFTTGVESGGLRSGLSRTNNTWYALYAVKSQINTANFVIVGDTTLPLAANIATLNGRYATNGWIYLGMIRHGENTGAGNGLDNVIVNFVQSGSEFQFLSFTTNIGSGPFLEEGFLNLGSLAQTNAQSGGTVYTISPGTGAAQIPDHILFGLFELSQSASPSGANFGNILVEPVALGNSGRVITFKGMATGDFRAGVEFVWPVVRGIAVTTPVGNWPASSTFTAQLMGWKDPVLAVGHNNTI